MCNGILGEIMTKRLVRAYIFVVCVCVGCIYAHEFEPWSKKYGIKDVPPTAVNLRKHEKNVREQQALKKIEKVVSKIVRDEEKKKRRKKKRKRKKRKKKKIKNKDKKDPSRHSPSQGSGSPSQSSHKASTGTAGRTGVKETYTVDTKGKEVSPEVRFLLHKQYEDPVLVNKKVSLHLKKVNVRHALDLLSKTTGVTFVVDADVDGSIRNFNFQEISLAAALNIVLNNNVPRLGLVKELGMYRIVKQPIAIEMLKLKAHEMHEQDMCLEIYTVYHATWDKSFKTRLEKLWHNITVKHVKKDGSYIIFDDSSRKIFFRGRTKFVADFKKCLQEIDIRIPQVRIEARVIVAEKDFEEAIGFEWSGVYDRRASVSKSGIGFVGLGSGKGQTGGDIDSKKAFEKTLTWALNFIPTKIVNKSMNIPFVFGNKDLSTKRLNLILNAAEHKNEIKTVLKPSMLVKSDELAEILVGEEMPQEVRLQETVEGQLTNISTTSYKDVGMKIKVKPTVRPDNSSVFLDIYVENSERIAREAATNDPNALKTSFNYTIQTSRSKNRVLLKSGQTTMISGLMKNFKEKSKNGVPVLKDIPVLGWLFKGSRNAINDKQLLIFITPTVI